MDLTRFALFAIFAVFSFGVRETTSWRLNEDRSESYDLQKGPVFYEAYYPDESLTASGHQQIPLNTKAEGRYTDSGNILEKTYQSLEDSAYGMPYQRGSRESMNQRAFVANYDWPSQPVSVTSESFLNNPSEATERNTANVQAHKVARQLKRFVESVEDTGLRNSAVYSSQDDTVVNFQQPQLRRIYRDNLNYPERRVDETISIISSAIKNGALEISEEGLARLIQDKDENTRITSQQRFAQSDDIERNFNPTKRSVVSGASEIQERAEGWDTNFNRLGDGRNVQTLGDDYDDVRGPMSRMDFRPMENIFQPRPQVISYVFSPTKTSTKEFPSKSRADVPQTRSIRANERTTRNEIDNEIKKKSETSNVTPGVASIEVSEVTHHKIRHHHGEKSRRNRQRRQIPTGN